MLVLLFRDDQSLCDVKIDPMQIAIHPLPLVRFTDDIRVGLNDFCSSSMNSSLFLA